jgi:hypothetical protein
VPDRRHHVGIVDELERGRDAGGRIGGVVQHLALDLVGVVAVVRLLEREQEAVARAQGLQRVAAAERADEAELDRLPVLGKSASARHHDGGDGQRQNRASACLELVMIGASSARCRSMPHLGKTARPPRK